MTNFNRPRPRRFPPHVPWVLDEFGDPMPDDFMPDMPTSPKSEPAKKSAKSPQSCDSRSTLSPAARWPFERFKEYFVESDRSEESDDVAPEEASGLLLDTLTP